ncbi:calcium homeostasis modulator protein 3 [Microcaecilia unicolor]|uniref:Calcium homeostasis modulator protein 3 n=1 Tax=Microcaecilia unicolor TaxID=1415580 RepID=A0A6P7YD13_9AMPH|nr:calcium homeostasis modulator protein 3 [Microcaecilia unicolor]
MERFRMIFQYFQSNSESVMNGICGILALASVKIYSYFDFNCPCLPHYNMAYGMGVMFIPPIALFLCGLIVNRQSVIMLEEWKRPTGRRKKDLAIVKFMCFSVIQKAMIAPMVWIIVTLLDGKCFVCAFSGLVDPGKFSGFTNNTLQEIQLLLSKVPCKEDDLMRNNTSRKAVSRYLRCWSQALGWSILLFLIVLAFLAKSLRPCFNQTAFLQTRYWSNYIDIEQKIFDETCCEHAREFAHKCILHFFESMQVEIKMRCFKTQKAQKEEESNEEESCLHGITNQEQMNNLLKSWYQSRPPLDINQAIQYQHARARRLMSREGSQEGNMWHCPHHTKTSKETDV